ncbi:LPS O-antigen chain length determinant protein WzzB [Erwiniaceae bacterium BAC15a-03b]|uniref:Chain length determinant protein n=1 Tax=Winslowiella arboricola TaxID=2978220 RepID=A0A9J6PR58_9GAMM|nr:LPS O-antigen chain length determinant protein WzzB [Winslowiella arboricola]MCU5774296.1 LPS O-antigen chain length determinant protein WzzB [Winslowiella arboricola]MCU5778843.1 LPS O-antigen chain length determinant protein WzzB [Winslowiella arboricola]
MSNNNSEVSEQSPLRQTFYNNDNELDLLDVIAQLWRGKIIIIAVMVLAVVLAGIYLSVAKEKWTSHAIVTAPSAGQVANYNVALNALYSQYPQDKLAIGDLQKQLFGRFSASISALSGSLHNLEQPLDLKVEQLVKGQSDPLSIAFTAETAKQAQQELTKYIQTINDDVVDDYSADIMRNLTVKKRELTESLASQLQVAKDKKQRRIDVMKQALKIAESSNIEKSQLQQAEYLSDDTLYLLGTDALQSMIANEHTKPLAFDDYYYETQRGLLSIQNLKIQVDNLQSYRSIMQPDLPIRRDSPKKALIMILAVILGGIAGSAIVLGRNMACHYRETH